MEPGRGAAGEGDGMLMPWSWTVLAAPPSRREARVSMHARQVVPAVPQLSTGRQAGPPHSMASAAAPEPGSPEDLGHE